MKNKPKNIILFSLIIIVLLTFVALSCRPPEPIELFFTINRNNISRTVVSGYILGGNLGIWANDGDLDTPVPEYVTTLSPAIYRFPGGNLSNNYCWDEHKVFNNEKNIWESWEWGTDVDEFISFLNNTGCVPMFSVNPFDHTIDSADHSAVSEAEDLVEHFSNNGFPGAFYEFGNENDGSWNPMLTIEEYTERFIIFAQAMKAIDSSIKMMGPVGSGYNTEWIDGFLEGLDAGGNLDLLDYFSFHHYGGWISNSNSDGIDMDDPQDLEDMIGYIRNKCSSLGSPEIKIAVTEYNAAIWEEGCDRGMFTIEQGIWIADFTGMLFLHADMGNIWINIHPGSDPHSLIASETDPPSRTKNYWAYYMAAKALSGITPEEEVSVLNINPGADTLLVTVYGVKKSDNTIGILLINKYEASALCEISLSNIADFSSVTVYTLDESVYEQNDGPEESSLGVSDVLNLELPALTITAILLE